MENMYDAGTRSGQEIDTTKLQAVRAALPATSASIYLNTGTAGPLPVAVTDTLRTVIAGEADKGRSNTAAFAAFQEVTSADRRRLAAWVHADPDEIALTHNTSEGMNIVTWGLDWRPGDEALTTTVEHEGGLVPLYHLHHRRGVSLRFVELGEGDPAEALSALRQALTPRTRLFVLSHVSFSTGTCWPLAEMVALCHDHGVQVLVDGAQSVGAIDVDMHALGVDYYAFSGQKWLCGPEGTGALYVARHRQAELEPTYVGYNSINMAAYLTTDPHSLALAPGARRYEMGTLFRPGIHAQAAGLAWLQEEVTPAFVFSRIERLSAYCLDRVAAESSFRLVTPRDAHAGLVNFTVDGLGSDVIPCVNQLAEEGITLRYIPDNLALRLSSGFFNTEAEIDQALDAVARYAAGRGSR